MHHDDRNTPLAHLRAVRKRYGDVQALDGVDLALRPGQVLSLLGANGAGKSTAVGLLLGLLRPDAGEATLFGRPPTALAARRRIGVMLQSAGLHPTLRVGELVRLARSYYPVPRSIADCVALAGLDGLLDRRYGGLSGGQQRRVQFAIALCGRPQALFLDEPTTGLDIQVRQQVWRAVRELAGQGCAVLLTTHYLEEAEALSDRVAVLDRGRVAAEGSVAEVRSRVDRRRIRCVSGLEAEQVARWPHVQEARGGDGRLEIVADAAEPVVRRLLEADPQLQELEVLRAGLAEAFIELTRDMEQGDMRQEVA